MRGEVLGNQQSIEKTILLLCFTYSYFRKRKAEEEEEEAQQKKINAEWAKNFEVSEHFKYTTVFFCLCNARIRVLKGKSRGSCQ